MFWHLPQLRYKNSHVQFVSFKYLTPTPWIQVFYGTRFQSLLFCLKTVNFVEAGTLWKTSLNETRCIWHFWFGLSERSVVVSRLLILFADDDRTMVVDCESRSRQDIHDHFKEMFGKSK